MGRLRTNIKSMAKTKSKEEIERLYEETCAIFTDLKELKEKSLRRRAESQSKLNLICEQFDNELLRVHNFEYEHLCTKKQISLCNEYEFDRNEPALISKQEFYEKNPQQIIENEHDEKAQRLSHELMEKQTFLSNLQTKIGSICNQMNPLQKFMNLPLSMIYPKDSDIDSLPSPLFAIYQSFICQIHCQQLKQIKIAINESKKKRIYNELEDGELSQQKEQKTLIHSTTLNITFDDVGITVEFGFCSTHNLILIALQRQNENEWKYDENAIVFMNLFCAKHQMIKLPHSIQYEQRFFAFSWAQELGGCYFTNSE